MVAMTLSPVASHAYSYGFSRASNTPIRATISTGVSRGPDSRFSSMTASTWGSTSLSIFSAGLQRVGVMAVCRSRGRGLPCTGALLVCRGDRDSAELTRAGFHGRPRIAFRQEPVHQLGFAGPCQGEIGQL